MADTQDGPSIDSIGPDLLLNPIELACRILMGVVGRWSTPGGVGLMRGMCRPTLPMVAGSVGDATGLLGETVGYGRKRNVSRAVVALVGKPLLVLLGRAGRRHPSATTLRSVFAGGSLAGPHTLPL